MHTPRRVRFRSLVAPNDISLMFSAEGLSVDEAFSLFDTNFGVQKSKDMRKEKIALRRQLVEDGGTALHTESAKQDGVLHVEKGPTSSSL